MNSEVILSQDNVLTLSVSTDLDDLPLLAGIAASGQTESELLFCKYLHNVPHAYSLPYILSLIHSKNRQPRSMATRQFFEFPFSVRIKETISLLSSEHSDIRQEALMSLGSNRYIAALPEISKQLHHDDSKTVLAAFKALHLIDHPSSISDILPFLFSHQLIFRIAAIQALGVSMHFKRWQTFLPLLASNAPDEQIAALSAITQKAGRKAIKTLLLVLQKERRSQAINSLVNELIKFPNRQVFKIFLHIAISDPQPSVRLRLSAAIDDLPKDFLLRQCLDVLEHGQAAERAFVLKKMSQHHLARAGELLAYHLERYTDPQIVLAALQGFQDLRDPQFIPLLETHVLSKDSLERYLATLAILKSMASLGDCPILLNILKSPSREVELEKQAILQYLVLHPHFPFPEEDRLAYILPNLQFFGSGVRYLAIALLRYCSKKDAIKLLIEAYLSSKTNADKAHSKNTLDLLLEGDLFAICEMAIKNQIRSSQTPQKIDVENEMVPVSDLLDLTLKLSWNPPFSKYLFTLLERSKFDCNMAQHPLLNNASRTQVYALAKRLFEYWPELIKKAYRSQGNSGLFLTFASEFWLAEIWDLKTPSQHEEWRQLFNSVSAAQLPTLLSSLKGKASAWAIPDLIERTCKEKDPTIQAQLRAQVTLLMEVNPSHG